MADKSDSSTSLEQKYSELLVDEDIIDVTSGLTSEIAYCKEGLQKAQKIIRVYQQQNKFLKDENEKLSKKCYQLQHTLKQFMKKLIKYEEERSKNLEMARQIDELNNKMQFYQKTIQILQDKLTLLNVAIKKQEYNSRITEKEIQTQKNHQNIFFKSDDLFRGIPKTPKRGQNFSQNIQKPIKTEYENSILQKTHKKQERTLQQQYGLMKKIKRIQTQILNDTDRSSTSRSSRIS